MRSSSTLRLPQLPAAPSVVPFTRPEGMRRSNSLGSVINVGSVSSSNSPPNHDPSSVRTRPWAGINRASSMSGLTTRMYDSNGTGIASYQHSLPTSGQTSPTVSAGYDGMANVGPVLLSSRNPSFAVSAGSSNTLTSLKNSPNFNVRICAREDTPYLKNTLQSPTSTKSHSTIRLRPIP